MGNSCLAEKKSLCVVKSVGDSVADGRYFLHSSFTSAANFISEDGAFVCLVSAVKEGGPFNIVLSSGVPAMTGSIKISLPIIEVDGAVADTSRAKIYDSAVSSLRGGFAGLAALEKEYLRLASPLSLALALDKRRIEGFRPGFQRTLAEQILQACALLSGGDYAGGARLLNGAGFGFTPSGDDFLAGVLLATHFLPAGEPARSAIFGAAASSNPVSLAAMRAARDGRACEPVKKLLTALSLGEDASSLLPAVLGMGATSGADFLAGFIFAFKSFKGEGRC